MISAQWVVCVYCVVVSSYTVVASGPTEYHRLILGAVLQEIETREAVFGMPCHHGATPGIFTVAGTAETDYSSDCELIDGCNSMQQPVTKVLC